MYRYTSQYEIPLGRWPEMSFKQAEAARAKAWSEYVEEGQRAPRHRTEKFKAKAELTKEAQAEILFVQQNRLFITFGAMALIASCCALVGALMRLRYTPMPKCWTIIRQTGSGCTHPFGKL
jgi:hypothetical protein